MVAFVSTLFHLLGMKSLIGDLKFQSKQVRKASIASTACHGYASTGTLELEVQKRNRAVVPGVRQE